MDLLAKWFAGIDAVSHTPAVSRFSDIPGFIEFSNQLAYCPLGHA
jgi:hypothetical protein